MEDQPVTTSTPAASIGQRLESLGRKITEQLTPELSIDRVSKALLQFVREGCKRIGYCDPDEDRDPVLVLYYNPAGLQHRRLVAGLSFESRNA